MIYRHKKSGKLYRLLFIAIDCTNVRDGTSVVIYTPADDSGHKFVREEEEWNCRFEPASAEEKNEIVC